MSEIAFLGTGTMGLPMAANLAGRGLSVRAWNRSRERAEPLREHGVELAGEPADAARGAEIAITMLSAAPAVLDVAAEAVGELARGATWIQMSTIGTEGTSQCAELAERHGVTFVDAPVLGTKQPAEQRQLVVLASGPPEARERCRPVFEGVGQRTLWLGEAGAGTRLKLVVNAWLVGVVGVLAETIAMAEGLDLDPQSFFEAIDGGALDLPYAKLKGAAMVNRSFDSSFRLSLARKDAELALTAARDADLEAAVLQSVLRKLREAEGLGHGDEDMSAVYLAMAPTEDAA